MLILDKRQQTMAAMLKEFLSNEQQGRSNAGLRQLGRFLNGFYVIIPTSMSTRTNLINFITLFMH